MADLDAAWTRLETAAKAAGEKRIVEFFDAEPQRLETLTLDVAGLHLDLSKQAWDEAGLEAALDLAHAADVEGARARMLGGEAINSSEGRAVLHVALRAKADADIKAQGVPVMADVEAVRSRMKAFAEAVRSGAIKGATGKPFKAILHIGIGGSDLGPRLLWDALRPVKPEIDLRFVANVDGAEFLLTTADLDPEETLVVVVSKTFTTQETMSNAAAARAWLVAAVGEQGANAHLAAVSTALDKTSAFGVADERVFGFWDWVGGRYSLWSAVSLSVAVAAGWDVFQGFLDGAAEMDAHFASAPLEKNAPVLVALAQIFNRNGLDRRARSVVPYSHRLRRLASFLQQLEMESNGKSVGPNGQLAARGTATVVFGDEGTNVQHAYFQCMHQGTDITPMELIGLAKSDEGPAGMHEKLLSNLLAQAEAFMVGRTTEDVVAELQAKGVSEAEIATLAPQRTFAGNRPSTLVLLDRLTPQTFGALIALYEHKTFVEGVIWGINSFDQWGVELGKVMANRILPELEAGAVGSHDASTSALIDRLKK
ncbi:glucose-6-phosphate isomerase [Caulobacter sp. D4A]|uniref:glucose-6-phosphate isomerase n=1 Tax=unclassified Caulobacter TaxID=2648921 RepID=UPI000D72D8B0|nr:MULTISPECIES: glucose-6-phosphate isomerase [unclassified Caulobacter]PXA84454.1 glucose-6-phosphate isomerase [Caulobacter sp. D4A]PXA95679.1 glucose-6-phosphate isomerase [Caulobacter sp. D5]